MRKLLLSLIVACLNLSLYATIPQFKSQQLTHANSSNESTIFESGKYLNFGYCGDLSGGLQIGDAGTINKAAIRIPKATAQTYIDLDLSAIQIAVGNTTVTNISIFLATSLTGDPFYTQEATITSNSWNTIVLDTPYKIEGKAFYIGYSCTQAGSSDYTLGFDGLSEPLNNNSEYIYYAPDDKYYRASQLVEGAGNLCIRAIICGDNLPQSNIALKQCTAPASIIPGEEFSIECTFRNLAAGSVKNLEVSYQIGNQEQVTTTVDTTPIDADAEGVESSRYGKFTISGLVNNDPMLSMPINLTVNKVNNIDDSDLSDNTIETTAICLSKLYPRNVVVEEWTGAWCQFCVRGIVSLREMKASYPDSFIGIAIHNGDDMAYDDYLLHIYDYFEYMGGFPGCVVNRKVNNIIDPNMTDLPNTFNAERELQAIADVNLTAEWQNDDETIAITTQTEFSYVEENIDYGLEIVIIENQVNSHDKQKNAYAGGTLGEMGGFEDLEANVTMKFDDVARLRTDATLDNDGTSRPTTETRYTLNTTITRPSLIQTPNNTEAIAMIINKSTGEIVNAKMVKITGSTGIEDVTDSPKVSITGTDGGVVIEGSYNKATVYTLTGAIVADFQNEAF
ncbi:MAG: hypothetical protein IJZ17_02555, partial [Muribaculaceae bacterium]|nr:hypothetical protein [Muribaculaceae bacterium]